MNARVYVGRDAFRMATVLIACFGNAVCERIALDEVKRRAFRATTKTAPGLMFWAGVLSRAGTELATDESIRIITGLKEPELHKLARLERRSTPQVLPRATPPAI